MKNVNTINRTCSNEIEFINTVSEYMMARYQIAEKTSHKVMMVKTFVTAHNPYTEVVIITCEGEG